MTDRNLRQISSTDARFLLSSLLADVLHDALCTNQIDPNKYRILSDVAQSLGKGDPLVESPQPDKENTP